MNILVASIQLPWPPDSGGKVALYSSLSCLRNDHRFTLVCPVWDEKGLSDAAALQAHFPEIKVRGVYCGPAQAMIPPKDDILLRSFRWGARQYRKWRFAHPVNTAGAKEVSEIPYYPFAPLPEAFLDAVAEELSRETDLVQAEFAEMLSLGAWLPRGIPRIFIHHQLHFVYANRFSAVRLRGGYSEYLERIMRVQEEAYLRTFDGVVVFSEDDKRALATLLEEEKVYVSPFPIECRSAEPAERFEPYFTFLGSEEHFPNRDALEWLTTEVWPAISKQMPGCILRVIGSWGEASRARYSRSGVEFVGYVPDLESAVKGSVMLAPLRIGSGIRVKLLDAMIQGVPAVSTSIGCEGIPARDGIDILIRDDASEFASAAVELLNDRELRVRLANAGKSLVARFYSPEQVRKRRNEIYQKVCGQMSCLTQPRHGVAES
jgi:glycosyltransferase involved in cell wall biosynthesis